MNYKEHIHAEFSTCGSFIFCGTESGNINVWNTETGKYHCVKSVRIRSYSGLHFPAFGLKTGRYGVSLRMRETADQNNSEYGHFLRSVPINPSSTHLLCVTMSVGLKVSYQFFSVRAHRIFLKFYMKLEGLKDQKLTEPNFSEKFLFWGKSLKIPPKLDFLALAKNLID